MEEIYFDGFEKFISQVYEDNLKQRKIIINQDIDDNIVEMAIMQILKFNEEDKDYPPELRRKIQIYINSCGGVVDIGLTLCDVIMNSKTPIEGIVLARAYSMGGLILLACHKRYCYKFSSYLLHDGSVGVSGSGKKAKNVMEFFEKQDEKIKEFILSRTNISEETYDEKYGDEWFIDSSEALEIGVVDEIIQ